MASNVIELAGKKYSIAYLKSVTEEKAVKKLKSFCKESQIRNAWKQANGKTVRNHAKNSTKKDKPEEGKK